MKLDCIFWGTVSLISIMSSSAGSTRQVTLDCNISVSMNVRARPMLPL